jgi:hypothetical protein
MCQGSAQVIVILQSVRLLFFFFLSFHQFACLDFIQLLFPSCSAFYPFDKLGGRVIDSPKVFQPILGQSAASKVSAV